MKNYGVLEKVDVSDPSFHQNDLIMDVFARMRQDDPIHETVSDRFGRFWSITRYNDIKEIERNYKQFSSEPEITIRDTPPEYRYPMFIAMDPPNHGRHRSVISKVLSPKNIKSMAEVIDKRTVNVLDRLPIDREFSWVDSVSVELTTLMLATILGVPIQDRHLLAKWTDMITQDVASGGSIDSNKKRYEKLLQTCAAYFIDLFRYYAKRAPEQNIISMMVHSGDMQKMNHDEIFGLVLLMLVGGSDTTRSSMSGGVVAIHKQPSLLPTLKRNPSLIAKKFVPEIIRWQTPLSHMRRTATEDVKFRDKTINAGDKVILWYLSGNYDETIITNPYTVDLERDSVNKHLSFGHGIHRCVGSLLAEIQLTNLWEQVVKRYNHIELTSEPVRTYSNFIHGWSEVNAQVFTK